MEGGGTGAEATGAAVAEFFFQNLLIVEIAPLLA